MEKIKTNITKFPEQEVDGVKIYGAESYENSIAVLSHELHKRKQTGYADVERAEMIHLIREFLDWKKMGKSMTEEEIGMVADNPFETDFFADFFKVPFPAPENPKFTFIDLFAGIGGFRLAMQALGGKCVFSSEWDSDAKRTYMSNFGEMPFGDITLQSTKSYIPKDFDVLCAGFPCQAFSIAGYRKGFEDTRGTLFFDVAQILKNHRPKAFYLENVKNLQGHDGGKTFSVIKNTLEDLGYVVYFKVMNSMEYANVPQNRERIFIIGFDPKRVPNHAEFRFPEKQELTNSIRNCIDYSVTDEKFFYREDKYCYAELLETMKNPNTVYQWRRQYVRENQSNVCPTLTANMGTGGHNVPLVIVPQGFRKLTPKECLNFQGYPADYKFPNIAVSKCYKQAGNSVTVPLIQAVAEGMIKQII